MTADERFPALEDGPGVLVTKESYDSFVCDNIDLAETNEVRWWWSCLQTDPGKAAASTRWRWPSNHQHQNLPPRAADEALRPLETTATATPEKQIDHLRY